MSCVCLQEVLLSKPMDRVYKYIKITKIYIINNVLCLLIALKKVKRRVETVAKKNIVQAIY